MASGPVDGTNTIMLFGAAELPAKKRSRTRVVSSPVAPEATPLGNRPHCRGRSPVPFSQVRIYIAGEPLAVGSKLIRMIASYVNAPVFVSDRKSTRLNSSHL